MSDPNSTIKHIRLALMYGVMEGPAWFRLIVVRSVVDACFHGPSLIDWTRPPLSSWCIHSSRMNIRDPPLIFSTYGTHSTRWSVSIPFCHCSSTLCFLCVDSFLPRTVSVTLLVWNAVRSVRRLFLTQFVVISSPRYNTDFSRGFIATHGSCEISTSLQRYDSTRRRKTTGRVRL
jgi:hypothetical protein